MLFHPHRFTTTAISLTSHEGPDTIDQAALHDFRETGVGSPELLCQLFEHEFREGLLSMLKEIRIAIPRVHGTSHSPLVKSICSRILYNHGGV